MWSSFVSANVIEKQLIIDSDNIGEVALRVSVYTKYLNRPHTSHVTYLGTPLRYSLFYRRYVFSQPSIYIDGWLYAVRMTSVVCNVPVLSQNDSTYHHSVFTT